jgi:hypothetical protein
MNMDNFAIFLFAAAVLMAGLVLHYPERVGQWQAERDLGYDAYLAATCDCVEEESY